MEDFYLQKVPEEISGLLQQEFQVQSFQQEFSVFYDGQVPNVAIYLVSGEIELVQGKDRQRVTSGHIVGLTHLYNQWASGADAKIRAGSTSVAIDRALLMSYLKGGNQLGQFFQDCLSRSEAKASNELAD